MTSVFSSAFHVLHELCQKPPPEKLSSFPSGIEHFSLSCFFYGLFEKRSPNWLSSIVSRLSTRIFSDKRRRINFSQSKIIEIIKKSLKLSTNSVPINRMCESAKIIIKMWAEWKSIEKVVIVSSKTNHLHTKSKNVKLYCARNRTNDNYRSL